MARYIQGEEIYNPQVSPEATIRRVTPRAPFMDVSSGIENIGQVLGQNLEKKYANDSTAWAATSASQFRLDQFQKLQDLKAKANPNDPGDFTAQFLAGYDKDSEQLLAKARGNPYAERVLQDAVTSTRTSMGEHSMEWEAQQRVAGQDNALENSLRTSAQLVRSNPKMLQETGRTLATQVQANLHDPAQKLQQMRTIDQALHESYGMGLADQDPTSVYSQLKPGGTIADKELGNLDPDRRERVYTYAESRVVDTLSDGVANEYRTAGWDAGAKAYSAIDATNLPDDVKDKARQRVGTLLGQLVQQRQQQYGNDVAYVDQQMHSPTPATDTADRIVGLRDHMAIERNTAGAYLGELDAKLAAQQKLTEPLARAEAAWNSGTYLDPKDTEDKKGADAWFQQTTQQLGYPAGSDKWIALAADQARHVGVIPKSVGEWARSVLATSEDPKEVMQAVGAVERMRLANPRSFQYWDDEHGLSRLADPIQNLVSAGITDPVRAIAMARKQIDLAQRPQESARLDQMWNSARPFGPGGSAVVQLLQGQLADYPQYKTGGGLFGGSIPPIPAGMASDFEALTRQYFNANGGNAAQAEASAARSLTNVWGITRMNGYPEIVKYSPEGRFRRPDGTPGVTADMIREDLKSQVDQHPEFWRHWDAPTSSWKPFTPDPANLRLVPIRATEESGGVTWGLEYLDPKTGTLDAIPDKRGRPATYDIPLDRKRIEQIGVEAQQRNEALGMERLKIRKLREQQMALDEQAAGARPFHR